jgi:hypothetical protein
MYIPALLLAAMTIQKVRKRDLTITIGDNFVPFHCIIWKIVDSIFHNKIK